MLWRRCHWTHPVGCEGSDGSDGSAGKVLKMDRPLAGGFLSLTGLWPEGCGIALWAMSFISRLRRSRQHRVSILSAYLVHPFPLRGTSPQGETRDMRKKQRVIYFRYHFGVFPLWWLAPPPFPRKRGHYKAPLCCELLMKGPLFRALFCPLHRGGSSAEPDRGWRTQ